MAVKAQEHWGEGLFKTCTLLSSVGIGVAGLPSMYLCLLTNLGLFLQPQGTVLVICKGHYKGYPGKHIKHPK